MMRSGRHGGFTLLEVLISLALIGGLLGALFGFYFNLLQSRNRITDRAEQLRGAQMMIDQIEQALLYSIVGDAKFGSGIEGANDRLSILTRGVSPSIAPDGANASLLDLQRLEISTTPNGAATMIRQPAILSSRETAQPGVVASQLGMVRFRYYDGASWVNSFDAMSSGMLPHAVEVAIWFRDPRPSEEVERLAAEQPESDMDKDDNGLFAGDSELFDPTMNGTLLNDDESEAWPLPDRYRIIVIPDAQASPPSSDQGGSP